MKAPIITRAGKQYVSQPATDGCVGCVASGATELCQALPPCPSIIFVEHKDEIKMKTPHKHAELIKAWADGAEIEMRFSSSWASLPKPRWDSEVAEYRIKPEPKPDVIQYYQALEKRIGQPMIETFGKNNLKLTFCGETGKLKSAEVI